MIRIFRYKKSVAVFLVLTYLAIGSGTGNALIWCRKSESFSHLEYNLAGECRALCHPVERGRELGGPATARPGLQSFGDDCLDTRISFSHTSVPVAKRLFADSSASGRPAAFHSLIPGNAPVTSFTRLNLGAQPPPLQALVALRTVVLLS